ncbi:PE family protein [Mycobacterium sp. MFM001]|uniref:PE family protein n=1 Tax=Mycobacterium sp. MFM001 TaxID=2049453 RepID=UPI000DA5314A|nr:PE family protein [Mycobacterium sp. MFM001]GBE66417.1 PE family protein [Mycobacterium sp. MFM001]
MNARPESLSAAVKMLQNAGVAMATQDGALAHTTAGLPPAADDEVSALMATQFALHGEMYQAISAQAKAMHEMFLGILSAGAQAATGTEAPKPV